MLVGIVNVQPEIIQKEGQAALAYNHQVTKYELNQANTKTKTKSRGRPWQAAIENALCSR